MGGRTERPGSGKYNHFFEEGTYYCSNCKNKHPLYSSKTKFDSGSGWPSFYDSVEGAIIEQIDPEDLSLGKHPRMEVLCARCKAHLGHVFDDGPRPTGKRHCINSYALQFEPKKSK